jgi:tetratricopeptide (TPR) repeat protein
MSATSKTQSRHRPPASGRADTPTARSTSPRLILLLFLGIVLVGLAWALRSSPWARENALRGKGTVELEAIVQQQPENALARYYLGKSYYLERRFTEARDNYAEAARLEPQWSRAHLGLALSLYELGEVTEARDAFRQTLKLDDRSAWAEYMLGKIAWGEGKIDEAREHVRRSTELDPRSDQAWFGLASCYTQRHEYDKAIAALEKAVAQRETSARHHTALGELLVFRGRRDKGLRHYQRALELDPNYGPACALLGRYYLQQAAGPDSVDRAQELLERAVRLKTVRPADVQLDLGQVYLQKKLYDKAIPALRQSIRLEPSDERPYFVLANALRRSGHIQEADAMEKQFKRMSDLHVKLQGLEARVHHDSSNALAKLQLARLYRELGMRQKAAHQYTAYLELRPSAEDVARELARLVEGAGARAAGGPGEDFSLTLPPHE